MFACWFLTTPPCCVGPSRYCTQCSLCLLCSAWHLDMCARSVPCVFPFILCVPDRQQNIQCLRDRTQNTGGNNKDVEAQEESLRWWRAEWRSQSGNRRGTGGSILLSINRSPRSLQDSRGRWSSQHRSTWICSSSRSKFDLILYNVYLKRDNVTRQLTDSCGTLTIINSNTFGERQTAHEHKRLSCQHGGGRLMIGFVLQPQNHWATESTRDSAWSPAAEVIYARPSCWADTFQHVQIWEFRMMNLWK